MTEGDPEERPLTARERAERRRRLDAVFGDVLPEQTGDDRSEGGDSRSDAERWLQEQVPPHHGKT